MRPSRCASCGLKFSRGSTGTNYFKFSLSGTSTIQSRSLSGRHVSTSFLDPVLGGHDEAGLSPNAKSLPAECLVGVRLGPLNFLIPVCVDCLLWLLAFSGHAGGCLFWTDVVDTLIPHPMSIWEWTEREQRKAKTVNKKEH